MIDVNPPKHAGRSHCILILNRRDIRNPRAGGAEVYIHEVAKRLAKSYAIIMFSSAFSNCRSEEEIDGIKIVRRGSEYTVYLMALFYYFARFRKSIDEIVECKDGGVPWFTQFYSSKRKIALVHQTGRGADTPFNQSVWYYEFSSRLIGYFVYLLEPLILKAYREFDIITPSKSTKTDLERLGINPTRIEVAEPGITKAEEFRIKKSPIPTVIYLGRVNRYKRVEDVIKTFAIINKQIPASRLIVLGRGDSEYVDYLSDLSREKGVYEKVDFRGRVSEHEKMSLLGEAHLMLFTSIREGWGISVIEANSVGTPVVGYDVPGLQDSILDGRTGTLVGLGDIDAMANASITLLNDESMMWRAFSEEAMRWANTFSWDRSAEKFAHVIERHLRKDAI